MVEGAPLLRAYMHKMRIEGSNPSLSATTTAANSLRLKRSPAKLLVLRGFFFIPVDLAFPQNANSGVLKAVSLRT